MAFDPTQPADGSDVASAPVRAQFVALWRSLQEGNWIADPGYLTWPAESANGAAGQTTPPAHWQRSGTGSTLQRCGEGLTDTSDYESGGWACKLTYGSAPAHLSQRLLDVILGRLVGEKFTFGVGIGCSAVNAARGYLYDSVTGYSYSDYHTGGGGWEWLTGIHEVGNGASLDFGVELGSSSCWVQGATVLRGEVKPPFPILSRVVPGSVGFGYVGAPPATSYLDQALPPQRPLLATGVVLVALTAPSGGTLVMNMRRYDGSSWQDMLASDLTLSDGHDYVASNAMDTVYRYRCLDAFHGASGAFGADNIVQPYCVSNAGGAEQVTAVLRGLQFSRPQDDLTLFNDPSKYGG